MRKRDVAFFVPSREFTSPQWLFYLQSFAIRFYFDSNAFSDTICAMLGKIDWIEWRLVCGRRQTQCFLFFCLPPVPVAHFEQLFFADTTFVVVFRVFFVPHKLTVILVYAMKIEEAVFLFFFFGRAKAKRFVVLFTIDRVQVRLK